MANNFKTYKKDSEYSYTLGVFLTIELLLNKPEHALVVYAKEASERNSGVSKIRELCAGNGIPFEINDRMVDKLSTKENCYVVGLFNKFVTRLDPHGNHVILINPMDSGNLGTIMRTGVGFGFPDLAIITPSVDIFDPKTIRASMGAIFRMNFEHFGSFDDYASEFTGRRLYPFMLEGTVSVRDLRKIIEKPFSLIFGNESSGLPEYFSYIGTSVVIPHSNYIDSLNLSVAVGIAEYELCGI